MTDDAALVLELHAVGYRVAALVEEEATRRLATIRLIPPGERERGVVVDLLFASSGIEPEIDAGAALSRSSPSGGSIAVAISWPRSTSYGPPRPRPDPEHR